MTATNDGYGNWSATIPPIGIGGGAVVVNAVLDGGDPSAQLIVPPPQGVFVSAYHANMRQSAYGFVDVQDWQDGQGGKETEFDYGDGLPYLPEANMTVWPTNHWPQALPNGIDTNTQWNDLSASSATNTYTVGSAPQTQEHCDTLESWMDSYNFGTDTTRRTADAEMKLATGGPLGSKAVNLWCLTATARDEDTGLPIPPEQISIGSFGNLDTNGNLYVVLPDNDPPTVTPKVNGNSHNTFTIGATKNTPTSWTWYPAVTNTNRDRTTLGVGEQVYLGGMPDNTMWTASAGGLSATNGNTVTFTAPSNAPSGGVIATVIGTCETASLAILFKVVPPSGIDHAKIIGTNHFAIGEAGTIMTNAVWIAPTSVSFYRVQIIEVGLQATNVSGYFTNLPSSDLNHHNQGADQWFYLTSNNEWWDIAGGGPLLPPWTTGGFTWDIPARWKVEDSDTNSMSGWNQSLSMDANGTVTIRKFGNTMIRNTNDVVNTN